MKVSSSLFLYLSLVLLTGCSSGAYLYIQTPSEVNESRPVYFTFRFMSESDFLATTYTQAAQWAQEKSQTKAPFLFLLPGQTKEVPLPQPEKELGLGIFFFFQKPGERWKAFIPPPLPSAITLRLGQNQIESLEW